MFEKIKMPSIFQKLLIIVILTGKAAIRCKPDCMIFKYRNLILVKG